MSSEPVRKIDTPTLVAIAVLAYAISNVVHEGVGHGSACLLAGGKPVELNAVYFQCTEDLLSPAGERLLAAGGTLANLVLAALMALALLPKRAPTPARYFAWLVESICLLQATGYLFFSGVGDFGDWAVVTHGLGPPAVVRGALVVVGALTAYAAILHAVAGLVPFLGGATGRIARARTLLLVPYLTGGVLFVAAGALNPASPLLILLSAAAASFGGTSAFAWMHNLLRNERRYPPDDGSELVLPRSVPIIVTAAVVAVVFIVVLGRSVHF